MTSQVVTVAPLMPTRLLHTMLRVVDLDASVDFYTSVLGMRLLRRVDFAEGRFTLAFVGYDTEESGAVLELTHNWDRTDPYQIGDGYGHIALATSNIYAVCERLANAGVTISRAPGPLKNSTRVIAFIKDPDGYPIELIERD